MRVTVHHHGHTTSHESSWRLELGGDPASPEGIVANGRGPWRATLHGATLVAAGLPCTLNGVPCVGEQQVAFGDVLIVGDDRIVFGYREVPLPAARPLDPVEHALLSRVGAEADEHLRRVLADHWLMGADEARGQLVQQQCEGLDGAELIAKHGMRWRRTAIAAGFLTPDLELRRGFVSAALIVERGEPLLDCPDALRLSPRQYLLGRGIDASGLRRHHEVVARTLAGEHGRYVLKVALGRGAESPVVRDAMILGELDHPNVVQLFDLALHRDEGLGVVMPWAGVPLPSRWRQGRADEPLALALGLPLCAALTALAARDIVHSDLRPGSVLLREDGHVTLAGFGDARMPGLPMAPNRGLRGVLHNRFRHMSREQVSGAQLTPATDVFSLAVLIATVALGHHPLPHIDSDFDTLHAIRDHRHVVPGDSPLLRLLATVIVPDAAARPTARELATGLAELGAPDPARIARLVAEPPP